MLPSKPLTPPQRKYETPTLTLKLRQPLLGLVSVLAALRQIERVSRLAPHFQAPRRQGLPKAAQAAYEMDTSRVDFAQSLPSSPPRHAHIFPISRPSHRHNKHQLRRPIRRLPPNRLLNSPIPPRLSPTFMRSPSISCNYPHKLGASSYENMIPCLSKSKRNGVPGWIELMFMLISQGVCTAGRPSGLGSEG